MTKKLIIAAALSALCTGAFAQEYKSGNIQVQLLFGNGMVFDQATDNYLLPKYSQDPSVGIGIGNNYGSQSQDPGVYLNFNDLGSNSWGNIAGIQFGYYLSDEMEINAMFAMDIRSTPKKDLWEGVAGNTISVQNMCYMEGRLSNNWIGSLGFNYHLSPNDRVDLYVGAQAGYQQGRITTVSPYTGNPAAPVYRPDDKKGQIHCITGAAVAGISYYLAPGLSLGFEAAPVAYQYSILEVIPTGLGVYQADHHAVRLLANPMLKLGIRF